MGRKALLFVPETNLVELHRVLGEYRPFLEQFAGVSNLSSLFGRVNTVIRTSPQQTNGEAETLVQSLPALERIVRRAEESLALPGTPPSPGVDALFSAGAAAENRKYITLGAGRIYLVTAKPRVRHAGRICAPAAHRLAAAHRPRRAGHGGGPRGPTKGGPSPAQRAGRAPVPGAGGRGGGGGPRRQRRRHRRGGARLRRDGAEPARLDWWPRSCPSCWSC